MPGGLTRRVMLASVALVVLIGGAFAVLLVALDSMRDSGALARHSRVELSAGDRLEKRVVDLETGQRGFVITHEPRFLAPWRAARSALPVAGRRLLTLAGDRGHQSQAARIVRHETGWRRAFSVQTAHALHQRLPGRPAGIGDGASAGGLAKQVHDLQIGRDEVRLELRVGEWPIGQPLAHTGGLDLEDARLLEPLALPVARREHQLPTWVQRRGDRPQRPNSLAHVPERVADAEHGVVAAARLEVDPRAHARRHLHPVLGGERPGALDHRRAEVGRLRPVARLREADRQQPDPARAVQHSGARRHVEERRERLDIARRRAQRLRCQVLVDRGELLVCRYGGILFV